MKIELEAILLSIKLAMVRVPRATTILCTNRKHWLTIKVYLNVLV